MDFGPYELLERIGSGGMAEVYRARTFADNVEKQVAIKRMLPWLSQDTRFVEMFVREARTTANLNHGNIVQVFDFGCIDQTYYLAMELVDGPDLSRIIAQVSQRGETIPTSIAIHICVGVCQALAYAHARRDEDHPFGIIHRDVSPQNVLVSYDGDVKLVDFGIAKARQCVSETVRGRVRGKSGYLSPEQIRGAPIDGRSDLFGLATVLHELLSGRPLFATGTPAGSMRRVLDADIPPASRANPQVSSELDVIVLRGLSRDVTRRYQTAEQLHADLLNYAFATSSTLLASDLSRWMKTRILPDPALAGILSASGDISGEGSSGMTPGALRERVIGFGPTSSELSRPRWDLQDSPPEPTSTETVDEEDLSTTARQPQRSRHRFSEDFERSTVRNAKMADQPARPPDDDLPVEPTAVDSSAPAGLAQADDLAEETRLEETPVRAAVGSGALEQEEPTIQSDANALLGDADEPTKAWAGFGTPARPASDCSRSAARGFAPPGGPSATVAAEPDEGTIVFKSGDSGVAAASMLGAQLPGVSPPIVGAPGHVHADDDLPPTYREPRARASSNLEQHAAFVAVGGNDSIAAAKPQQWPSHETQAKTSVVSDGGGGGWRSEVLSTIAASDSTITTDSEAGGGFTPPYEQPTRDLRSGEKNELIDAVRVTSGQLQSGEVLIPRPEAEPVLGAPSVAPPSPAPIWQWLGIALVVGIAGAAAALLYYLTSSG